MKPLTKRIHDVDRHFDDVFDIERFGLFLRKHLLMQLENLIEYHFVKSRLNDGRLKLHGCVFNEGIRRVRAYDAFIGDFVSVGTDAFSPVIA